MIIEIVGGCFMGVFFLALLKAVMEDKNGRRNKRGNELPGDKTRAEEKDEEETV